ncbi:MAG: 3-hydroxyacyl-ACP dehydratase FabZ [Desulfobacteraceae bacterium]|nr:3-hydroxyacyl-ACP dehydratase FabZ [Desulfobacteraceae bacterium]
MTSAPESFDIVEIMRLLPHRYPFIMVDRVLELTAGERIKALKNVTINEPFFQGHFPVLPVMPGVMILEGLAQAAAVLAYATMKEYVGSKLVYFAGLDQVRFRRKVSPGDQLIYEVKTIKRKLSLWTLEGKAYVDDKLVAEAILMATFG